jgi:hypothetical protein
MLTGRVGNGVRGLNASLLPWERQDSLLGCNSRLMRLVVAGAGLAPLMVGKASSAPRRSRLSVCNGVCFTAIAPNDAAVRAAQKPETMRTRYASCSIGTLPLHPGIVSEFGF